MTLLGIMSPGIVMLAVIAAAVIAMVVIHSQDWDE